MTTEAERPKSDEEVRAMLKATRRRGIVSVLQQVVTTERSARQTRDELLRLPGGGGSPSGQEQDSLRLALDDVEAAQKLLERARVLISGSGAIS